MLHKVGSNNMFILIGGICKLVNSILEPLLLLCLDLFSESFLSSLFVLVDASQDLFTFGEGSNDIVDPEVVHDI